MHKEDQQAGGGPTSLGVTSKEGAHPQLSSANSTEVDPKTSAPNDSLPIQQGKDEGTKNYSLDHIFAGTDPNVLADKTKYVSDGLETFLATLETGTKNVVKPSEEIKCEEIKIEDLAKLVPNFKADFKDLDSLEDGPIIVVGNSEEDEEEDKNEEIHSTTNDETKDISASTPPSPSSLPIKLKELTSMFTKLTDEVKALKTQIHGLEIEVLGDLKDLPTKLEEFTTTVTSLTSQVAELKTLQWELPVEFLLVPNQVASVQAKLKTLDALPSLLLKVTQALNMFSKVLHSASKAGDQRVPSAWKASTMPTEGEKNTNQATM
ncbi:hypothetical protein Tco_0633841 [Tanacetum coccineum]